MLTDADKRYALQFARQHGIAERKAQSVFYKALAESVIPVFSSLNPNDVRSDVWLKAYQQVYKQVGLRFGNLEYNYLKGQETKDFVGFFNDIFAGIMSSYGATVAFNFSKDLTQTTIEQIQKALAEASTNYLTNSQTARLIKKYTLGDVGKARALLIARTETTTAANIAKIEGAKQYFKEVGQEASNGYKMWISRLDGRERHDHMIANEEIVPFLAKFKVGEEEANAPGDPSLSAKERIRCRCTFVTLSEAGYRRRVNS